MSTFRYTPDVEDKVHHGNAIRLLCRTLQSHEKGLPEWAKNSADEYARRDTPPSDRVIVLIFRNGRPGRSPTVSCLDFAGMSSTKIEEKFRVWADPEAARGSVGSDQVQGGHGNGGKSYMTQMFTDYAVLHTVYSGHGNRYGVCGGSIRFGYVPNQSQGRDFDVADVSGEMGRALEGTGCLVAGLPDAARLALEASEGFTLLKGVGPKGFRGRLPVASLVDSLREEPQMLRTLQMCRVLVVADGKVLNNAEPLAPPEIEPIEGAEAPRVIPVPDHVRDPVTEERVSTRDDGRLPAGKLVLRTSKTSMRWKKKTRHAIAYFAQSGLIGYVPVFDLDVQSSYRDKIYAECLLGGLEPYKTNERARLAESPLTRGLERFIGYEIQRYAEEFEL